MARRMSISDAEDATCNLSAALQRGETLSARFEYGTSGLSKSHLETLSNASKKTNDAYLFSDRINYSIGQMAKWSCAK